MLPKIRSFNTLGLVLTARISLGISVQKSYLTPQQVIPSRESCMKVITFKKNLHPNLRKTSNIPKKKKIVYPGFPQKMNSEKVY